MGYKFTIDKESTSEYYYTKYGKCRLELKQYVDTLTDSGTILTQAQFDAFNDFMNNLSDLKILDKVKEIYPLYGDNIDSFRTKLKYINAEKLTLENGFDITRAELSNGKYIGKNDTSYISTNCPCLGTGVKISDLNGSFNVTALVGADVNTTNGGKWLLGAIQDATSTPSTHVGFVLNATGFQADIANGSGSIGRRVVTNSPGVFSFNSYATYCRYYKDAISLSRVSGTTVSTANNSQEFFLFARRGYGTNSTLSSGITQKVRLVVISQELKYFEVASLTEQVNLLSSKLGKNF